jgi:hypothetical protein
MKKWILLAAVTLVPLGSSLAQDRDRPDYRDRGPRRPDPAADDANREAREQLKEQIKSYESRLAYERDRNQRRIEYFKGDRDAVQNEKARFERYVADVQAKIDAAKRDLAELERPTVDVRAIRQRLKDIEEDINLERTRFGGEMEYLAERVKIGQRAAQRMDEEDARHDETVRDLAEERQRLLRELDRGGERRRIEDLVADLKAQLAEQDSRLQVEEKRHQRRLAYVRYDQIDEEKQRHDQRVAEINARKTALAKEIDQITRPPRRVTMNELVGQMKAEDDALAQERSRHAARVDELQKAERQGRRVDVLLSQEEILHRDRIRDLFDRKHRIYLQIEDLKRAGGPGGR